MNQRTDSWKKNLASNVANLSNSPLGLLLSHTQVVARLNRRQNRQQRSPGPDRPTTLPRLYADGSGEAFAAWRRTLAA